MNLLRPTPRISFFAAGAAAAALLAGCGATGPTYPSNQPVAQPTYGSPSSQVQYGRVERVEVVKAENQTSGAGAALGGVLGAVVGRQIGGGTGRDVATVAGAVGGALVGNQIEKNRKEVRDFVRVTVRLDRGGTEAFDFEQGVQVQPGERVYVQNGQLMRY